MTKKFCLLCFIAVFALLPCLVSASPPAPPIAVNQEKKVIKFVRSAVKLLKAKGETAFDELNVKNGRWHKHDVSIFVNSETGVELVNPGQPKLVGQNLWNFKGPDGKLIIQEQWKLVKAKGEGWSDCMWIKPGTDKAFPCRVFVQGVKVEDKLYMVGAYYFLK